jgi:CRISPR-associated protein Cas1
VERIVDIDRPAKLSTKLDCLVVERKGEHDVVIPGVEIVVLILVDQGILLTSAALSLLANSGAAVVSLDSRHLPCGMTLPIAGHSRHTERLRLQVSATEEKRAQMWRRVVDEKIEAQAKHLDDHGQKHSLRELLHAPVPEEAEAQAARLYWRLLFGPNFTRRDPDDKINPLLNYGYAVVRAMTARSICATGLHPALGIHHKNQYNAFVLADDLMEPFRPWIDRVVLSLENTDASKENKRALLVAATEIHGSIQALVRSYYEILRAP